MNIQYNLSFDRALYFTYSLFHEMGATFRGDQHRYHRSGC